MAVAPATAAPIPNPEKWWKNHLEHKSQKIQTVKM